MNNNNETNSNTTRAGVISDFLLIISLSITSVIVDMKKGLIYNHSIDPDVFSIIQAIPLTNPGTYSCNSTIIA